MDEQQSVPVRRRRSRAEVADLVAEYEASGLSRIEFCRKHGLSLSTFNRYWKRRQTQAEDIPEIGGKCLTNLCRTGVNPFGPLGLTGLYIGGPGIIADCYVQWTAAGPADEAITQVTGSRRVAG